MLPEFHLDIKIFKKAECISRVIAAQKHIAEEIFHLVMAQGSQHILRFAAGRISRASAKHHADLHIRVLLMGIFCSPCTGNHFIMHCLIFGGKHILHHILRHAKVIEGFMDNQINLVHNNPIFHFTSITVEYRFTVFFKKVNHFPGIPSLILQCKV